MQSLLDIILRFRRQGQNEIKDAVNDLKGLDNAAGMLSQGLAGLAAGAGIAGIVQVVRELDELGRRGAVFEQLGSVLDAFTAKMGTSSQAMIGAAQRAAQGTISQYELILNANRALQFEVAKTPEAFAKLVELSTALGRAQGVSDTQALEFLTTGLARESRLILDNLGLIIDTDKATAAYAATIGKTADQLSSAERKTALLNAAFEQGQSAIEANRNAAESAATQYERLDANTQNLKDILGQLIAQNSAGFIKSLADALGEANDVLSGEGDLPNWLVGLGAGIQGLADSMGGATPATALLKAVLDALGLSIQALDQSTREGRSAFDEATDAFMAMEGMASNAGKALQMAASDMDAAGQSAALAAIDVGALGDSLANLARSNASAIINAARGVSQIVGGAQAKDLAAQQLRYLQEQSRELEKQGVTGLDLIFQMEEIKSNSLGVFENIQEADRAAQRAATGGVAAMNKAAQEAERAFESLKGKVAGVLSGALDPGVGVNPDEILESLGLRGDAINEDARRLADVAVNGFKSPWLDYFRSDFPALFQEFFAGAADDNGVKAQAAQLLKNFQDGLNPELIDRDSAKERVRRMLIGEQRMEDLATEIAQELAGEFGGVGAGRIQDLAMGALGGGASGLLGAPDRQQVAEQYGGVGATAAEAFSSGVRGAVVDGNLGSQVTAALDEQLRAESNLARLTEGGRLSGSAWGGGFLEVVGDNVPARLIEILAQLVTPAVDALLIQRQTLQGAR